MVNIQIIVGSTRPGRKALAVAQWVHEIASKNAGLTAEVVDIVDYNLPILDEPISPSQHQYSKDHTKRWATKIEQADGFIFVTPEYNHSTSAALKNALDFLGQEWYNKAAAFVSYGASANGVRAVEHLRQIVGELQMADVKAQVGLSLSTDFENYTTFKPDPSRVKQLESLFNQLVPWAEALKTVRTKMV